MSSPAPRISGPAKSLLVAAAAALAIVGYGLAGHLQHQADLRAHVAACEKEANRPVTKPDGQDVTLRLMCDPRELDKGVDLPAGIQGQIVLAQREVDGGWGEEGLIAILVLLVGAIPWGWYFLLERIREMRQAALGR